QVLSYLMPLDILHISRTCRSLRRALMNHSAQLVWRRAQLNVPGLPYCPSFLSEPAYASLVFEETCARCACGNVGLEWIIWEFRARCCRECQEQM
ncbi:hypothetical protein BKA93DRAFT_734245, partial [Sparassis latifolia]